MKKIIFVSIIIFIFYVLSGCKSDNDVTERKVGKMPKNWWTMSDPAIEQYIRENGAEGVYKKIVVFTGKNTGETIEEIAMEKARLSANAKLSRYIATKATTFTQSAMNQVDNYAKDEKIKKKDVQIIKERFEKIFSNFTATVSTTQFSGFRETDNHVEKAKDGTFIVYICFWMDEAILEQTREIQKKAFETIIVDTQEYKDIMTEINNLIATQMLNNIMDTTGMSRE